MMPRPGLVLVGVAEAAERRLVWLWRDRAVRVWCGDFLSYARVAKRVDVKRLKNNMWTSLNSATVCRTPNKILEQGARRV